MPTRIAAILIDWLSCLLVSAAFFASDNAATLVIFLATQSVFIATANGSLGHKLLRLRVIKIGHRQVGFSAAAIRSLLLILVLPVVIVDNNNRGLHDRAAKTALVKTR
ncbi:hypothetical protein A4Z71_03210 [Candidatus Rhodoluna planktonica]|uniref:RDD domain-containing protein n=2 Tax=Candidatus Rhodoluna planktonica TaxID=535712 RepID=A0A1D9DYX3_9MICO|nr:hypothetical protein A4Z71_03210 [Candidatus Rhodoluna planktonica]